MRCCASRKKTVSIITFPYPFPLCNILLSSKDSPATCLVGSSVARRLIFLQVSFRGTTGFLWRWGQHGLVERQQQMLYRSWDLWTEPENNVRKYLTDAKVYALTNILFRFVAKRGNHFSRLHQCDFASVCGWNMEHWMLSTSVGNFDTFTQLPLTVTLYNIAVLHHNIVLRKTPSKTIKPRETTSVPNRLPHKPGSSKRGICPTSASETRNTSYFLASLLTSFLLSFILRTTDQHQLEIIRMQTSHINLPASFVNFKSADVFVFSQ